MRLNGLVLGCLLAVVSFADTRAESLKSALGAAYNSNPTLNAQRAATRANDENLAQAKAGFRPTAFLTGRAAKRYSNTDLGRSSSTTPWGYGIEINQNLFNGFRTVNNIRAAKASIFASRETLRNVEQNVLLSGVQAYVAVAQAIDLLDIRQRNIKFLREQLRSSDARLEVGDLGIDVEWVLTPPWIAASRQCRCRGGVAPGRNSGHTQGYKPDCEPCRGAWG